jgi:hypothetical protein
MPSITETTPTDPPESPRSQRGREPTTAERFATIEEWYRDIDARLIANEQRRDQQYDALLLSQQRTTSEVLSVRGLVSRLVSAVSELQTDLGAIARELSTRARHDSVHDERLSVADQQIASVKKRLTGRQIATYAFGTGGALALSTAALVLSRLVLQWLGVQH